MESLLVEIVPQLGVGAVLLYLLVQERSARQTLEKRVLDFMEEELEASRPKRPEGL